jgi:hypothetical protein
VSTSIRTEHVRQCAERRLDAPHDEEERRETASPKP